MKRTINVIIIIAFIFWVLSIIITLPLALTRVSIKKFKLARLVLPLTWILYVFVAYIFSYGNLSSNTSDIKLLTFLLIFFNSFFWY